MTQEQDPFIGADGEEDDSLIMAPLLIDKLQVGPLPLPHVPLHFSNGCRGSCDDDELIP